MEHRWGERRPVNLAVRLTVGRTLVVPGRMHDVSPSGAFIVTHVFLPLHARVEIELHSGCRRPDGSRGCRLSAFVVRNAPAGVGVEWCEFSPRGIQELGGTAPGKSLVPRRQARAAGPLSARESSCSDVC